MRTTITLAPDVAAAVAGVQRSSGTGLSAVVNELVRRGLAAPPDRTPFRQETHDLGMRMDVRNVAEVLDALDGPGRR